jgi:hypothetical protein
MIVWAIRLQRKRNFLQGGGDEIEDFPFGRGEVERMFVLAKIRSMRGEFNQHLIQHCLNIVRIVYILILFNLMTTV